MARGGFRPGAGRPKGSSKDTKVRAEIEARKSEKTPLEYMLGIMNDTSADDGRRDRMAIAAAAYIHAKPGDAKLGKKEQADADAQTAGVGTEWGDDLAVGATVN